MLEIYGDYHTHTVYSHGKGNIIDNVMAARKIGLKEIAITDHGLRHFAFGVKANNIIKMRYEIDKINDQYQDIKVLLGMECNIISTEGDIDVNDKALEYLDILLVGYHMMVLPKNINEAVKIYGKNYLKKLLPKLSERVKEANTEAIVKAVKKNKIDVITHPNARINVDIDCLASVAAKNGTALEINSKNNEIDREDIIKAAKHGVKFIINSDAHKPADVGNFNHGIKIAQEAGLNSSQIINAIK